MLPASDIAEILTNLSALNLQPTTTAQILAAVLAPLLRSTDPDPPALPRNRAERPQAKPRSVVRQKRKKFRPRETAAAAGEPKDAPRQRAIVALKANPGASANAVAKIAGVNRGTVIRARDQLAAEARKQARRQARQANKQARRSTLKPETIEHRARAQRFLKDTLAHGPQPVSAVEAAAEKAHVEPVALQQARGDLGVVVSRGNAGGVMAVQWSLPG